MIKLAIFATFFWLISLLTPTTKEIIVIDGNTKEPLAGVMVPLKSDTIYTDLEGKININTNEQFNVVTFDFISYYPLQTTLTSDTIKLTQKN